VGGPPIRLHQRLTTCFGWGPAGPHSRSLCLRAQAKRCTHNKALCAEAPHGHHRAGLSTVYRIRSEPSCTRKPVQVLIVTCQHYIQQHSSSTSPPGYPCSKGQTRVLVNNTQHTPLVRPHKLSPSTGKRIGCFNGNLTGGCLQHTISQTRQTRRDRFAHSIRAAAAAAASMLKAPAAALMLLDLCAAGVEEVAMGPGVTAAPP
jgi:hypothetical protein